MTNLFTGGNFYLLLFGGIVVLLVIGLVIHHYTFGASVRSIQNDALRRLKQCPVCGADVEAGTASGISFSKGFKTRFAVAAVRCVRCGHLDLFTEPDTSP